MYKLIKCGWMGRIGHCMKAQALHKTAVVKCHAINLICKGNKSKVLRVFFSTGKSVVMKTVTRMMNRDYYRKKRLL